MAITKEQKVDFNENLKEFKSYLDDLKKEVSLYKSQMKKFPGVEPYYNIALAINSIKYINTCLLINELSIAKMDIKNDNYLNLGRKEIYGAIAFVEKSVGSDVDGSLSENKDMLAKLEELTALQRLNLVKGIKQSIDLMIEAYGPNSKWKWSWPEIHFKLAVMAKNIFDWRTFEEARDLSHPDYYIRQELYNLVIEFCNFAAQEYRSKYDLSTNDTGDLKKSIMLLELNRKIFQITGNTDDLEKTKTLIESLKAKVEQIEGDKEKDKKKKK
ncbi:MAG: hypothetical protein K8R21_01960 [Leptospira sp.]|nr:hypothetical protein [Leptospira sp.]